MLVQATLTFNPLPKHTQLGCDGTDPTGGAAWLSICRIKPRLIFWSTEDSLLSALCEGMLMEWYRWLGLCRLLAVGTATSKFGVSMLGAGDATTLLEALGTQSGNIVSAADCGPGEHGCAA